ncbi:MAG: glycosyltransferase family 2 protein [Butyrivibrio sp.]|nr:glycosyltransferase family 2 protein [Acetatifactor muris]MCM1559466.1 glycosyltransferase family 2 protein [Butyrivibrio sp.]
MKSKISLIIPIYYNQDNIEPLYRDIVEKLYCHEDLDWEIVMVNDGSADNSYEIIKRIAAEDSRIKAISLSRNFGSHAAILCGLAECTGDCAVIKAADLQEPTELVIDMIASWRQGNNVVLAEREGREESRRQTLFAGFYYWLVRKAALPTMPKNGFDVYLIDRKVITVLTNLEETNSALTGQILWSGFKTGRVKYVRKAREIGTSKWTLKKKIRLVTDTLFSFSNLPITMVVFVGTISILVAAVWSLVVVYNKLTGSIPIDGFTTMLIVQLFSFGIIMMTLGILGEYLWRTFDASRGRPPYIIEDRYDASKDKEQK